MGERVIKCYLFFQFITNVDKWNKIMNTEAGKIFQHRAEKNISKFDSRN